MGRPEKPLKRSKAARSRLGEEMRSARNLALYRLTDFADEIGWSAGHLSNAEHGVRLPSQALVLAYENALETQGLLQSLRELALYEERVEKRQAPTPDLIQGRSAGVPEDRAVLIHETGTPDGRIVRPGSLVRRTFHLQNAGPLSWDGRYLRRRGPSGRGAPTGPRMFRIESTPAGEIARVEVQLRAPSLPGRSRTYFVMVDRDGRPYFTGRYADGVWIEVVVSGEPVRAAQLQRGPT